MRIAYDNYIDDLASTVITASTTATGYPVTNVQDQRLSTEFRTSATTAPQTVVMDFTTAKTMSVAAIINHNFTSSATVSIQANTSNSWGSPATSKTITYSANMMLNFFTDVSYRWWRFSISDAGNPDGYLSMGRLWLGTYITVEPSSLEDFQVIKKRSDRVIYGEGRQKFASIGVGWRRFELSFPESDYTAISKIETMYDTVGTHSSLIFCNFDTDRNYAIVEPCYCSIQDDIEFSHSNRMKFSYDLTLEEDL